MIGHFQRHAPKVADEHGDGFNGWLARKITGGVATMWAAYAFALLALISLPDAIHAGRAAIISWVAQTFLQLVLLSIILVGQKLLGAAGDARSEHMAAGIDTVLDRLDVNTQGGIADLEAKLDSLTHPKETP